VSGADGDVLGVAGENRDDGAVARVEREIAGGNVDGLGGGGLDGGDGGRVRRGGGAGASGDRLVCGQRANVELTVSNRGVDGAGGADGLGIGAVQGKDGASDHVGREVAAENFDILGGFAEDGQVGSSARGERCVAGGHSDGLGVEGLGE